MDIPKIPAATFRLMNESAYGTRNPASPGTNPTDGPTLGDTFSTTADAGASFKKWTGDGIKRSVEWAQKPRDVPFAEESKKLSAKLDELGGKVERFAQEHSPAYKKIAEERETKKAIREGRTIELD